MKKIELSRGGKNKGVYFALVDDEDFDYLNQYHWFVISKDHNKYASAIINGQNVLMHRLIMKTPEGLQTDHVFHDGLDNRKYIEIDGVLRCNLRNCTNSQNQMNKRSAKNSSSKYLGVCKIKRTMKYILKTGAISIHNYIYYSALIQHNKKEMYIGSFKTEEQAAKAYNTEAIKYHGEFANLNVI